MKPRMLYVGLDVDDTPYYDSALSKKGRRSVALSMSAEIAEGLRLSGLDLDTASGEGSWRWARRWTSLRPAPFHVNS